MIESSGGGEREQSRDPLSLREAAFLEGIASDLAFTCQISATRQRGIWQSRGVQMSRQSECMIFCKIQS